MRLEQKLRRRCLEDGPPDMISSAIRKCLIPDTAYMVEMTFPNSTQENSKLRMEPIPFHKLFSLSGALG